MDYPTPTWRNGKWHLDLRKPWDCGRHVLSVPAGPPEGAVAAVNASWALLLELRGQASLLRVQEALPGLDGRTVGDLLKEFLAYRLSAKKWGSEGSAEWGRAVCARLVRDIGRRPLAEFAPPDGLAHLEEYRDLCRAGSLGERVGAGRMNAIFCFLRQAFRWAAHPSRLWLPFMPEFPDPRIKAGELIHPALNEWIDEASFRAVRAAIYTCPRAFAALVGALDGRASDAHDLICRRQLYLSFAFYTGQRKRDLDSLDDSRLSLDLASYVCFSTKTHRDPCPFRCVPPLLADLQAERRRLGRPYKRDEAICGGPWPTVTEVIAKAARSIGLPPFDLRTCRRSFAQHKAAAGVQEGDLQRLMMHSDSRMIRRIYQRFLPAERAVEAGIAWPEIATNLPGTGLARVIPITRK